MSAVCNGQPLSWLRLERYHLGELDAGERRDIGEHLALCPACRACLERITGDRRELPPLPLPLTRSGPAGVRAWSVQPARVPLLSWPRRLAWASGLAGGALAAAALALLLLLPPPDGRRGGRGEPGSILPGSRMAYKGGELALALQRERAGAVVNDPARYLGGDRFRLLATCPPAEEELRWEVVVFQGGEAFFPLSGGQRLRCGNAVPLPGAFRLTGSGTATICLIAGADLPSRGSLARQGQTALPADATVCVALEGGVGE